MAPPCWREDSDSITHCLNAGAASGLPRNEPPPNPHRQDTLNSLCANEGSDLGVDGARSGTSRHRGRDEEGSGRGWSLPGSSEVPGTAAHPPGVSPPHRVPAQRVKAVTPARCALQGWVSGGWKSCQEMPSRAWGVQLVPSTAAAAMAGTCHSISPALALPFESQPPARAPGLFPT